MKSACVDVLSIILGTTIAPRCSTQAVYKRVQSINFRSFF